MKRSILLSSIIGLIFLTSTNQNKSFEQVVSFTKNIPQSTYIIVNKALNSIEALIENTAYRTSFFVPALPLAILIPKILKSLKIFDSKYDNHIYATIAAPILLIAGLHIITKIKDLFFSEEKTKTLNYIQTQLLSFLSLFFAGNKQFNVINILTSAMLTHHQESIPWTKTTEYITKYGLKVFFIYLTYKVIDFALHKDRRGIENFYEIINLTFLITSYWQFSKIKSRISELIVKIRRNAQLSTEELSELTNSPITHAELKEVQSYKNLLQNNQTEIDELEPGAPIIKGASAFNTI